MPLAAPRSCAVPRHFHSLCSLACSLSSPCSDSLLEHARIVLGQRLFRPWMFLHLCRTRARFLTPTRLTSNLLTPKLNLINSQAPRRTNSSTGPNETSKKMPSLPRPSASLLLVNQNDQVSDSPSVRRVPFQWSSVTQPLQVLIIQRTLSTSHFAGMHVSRFGN